MCDRFPQKFDVQTSYKPSNFVVNNKFPRTTCHTIVPSTEELYCLNKNTWDRSVSQIRSMVTIQISIHISLQFLYRLGQSASQRRGACVKKEFSEI